MTGLRDILESSSDEEREDQVETEAACSESGGDFNSILFGRLPYIVDSNPLQDPSEHVRRAKLFSVYSTRVDAIFKVGHWPTLETLLANQKSYNQTSSKFLAIQALQFAVCFTSVCTLTENECKQFMFDDKTTLIQFYRMEAESSLSRANLVCTSDTTVLQAFVVYLVSHIHTRFLPTK